MPPATRFIAGFSSQLNILSYFIFRKPFKHFIAFSMILDYDDLAVTPAEIKDEHPEVLSKLAGLSQPVPACLRLSGRQALANLVRIPL
jgi:hypothetical protein